MDLAQFQHLVKNYTNSTTGELEELRKLSKQFPYSQLIRVLEARASKDNASQSQNAALNLAAAYSADRSVIKKVMTSPKTPRVEMKPKVEGTPAKSVEQPAEGVRPKVATPKSVEQPGTAIKPKVAQSKPAEQLTAEVKAKVATAKTEESAKKELKPKQEDPPVVRVTGPPVDLTGDALRKDLAQELEKLQRLKGEFERSYDALHRGLPMPPPTTTSSEPKKARLVTDVDESPLITEIKTTRKRIDPLSPKLKEQNEIIEQFIKTPPPKPQVGRTQPAEDLSEESSSIGDNVVSETLVALLITQGKKEKAIEMLKKLIWKFPQKKAYFAAKIEELKN